MHVLRVCWRCYATPRRTRDRVVSDRWSCAPHHLVHRTPHQPNKCSRVSLITQSPLINSIYRLERFAGGDCITTFRLLRRVGACTGVRSRGISRTHHYYRGWCEVRDWKKENIGESYVIYKIYSIYRIYEIIML